MTATGERRRAAAVLRLAVAVAAAVGLTVVGWAAGACRDGGPSERETLVAASARLCAADIVDESWDDSDGDGIGWWTDRDTGDLLGPASRDAALARETGRCAERGLAHADDGDLDGIDGRIDTLDCVPVLPGQPADSSSCVEGP